MNFPSPATYHRVSQAGLLAPGSSYLPAFPEFNSSGSVGFCPRSQRRARSRIGASASRDSLLILTAPLRLCFIILMWNFCQPGITLRGAALRDPFQWHYSGICSKIVKWKSSRGGIRTPDRVVNSHLLCQLSYPGIFVESLAVLLLFMTYSNTYCS